MALSGKVSGLKALFTLENNIKVEGIIEAQREAVIKQTRKLDALAYSLHNKPSRSALKVLAGEVFNIRNDALKATLDLLARCKPALTAEQYSAIETEINENLNKSLQLVTNGTASITSDEEHPELIPLDGLDPKAEKAEKNPEQDSSLINDSPEKDKKLETASQPAG